MCSEKHQAMRTCSPRSGTPGRSPPVASHPISERRSYSRLQVGERVPGVDFHHSVRVRSQEH